MLAGEFETVSIDYIWVQRDERIRKVLTPEAIHEKMESISRIGLIHPLIIKRDGRLVAGETRLMAMTQLGWDRIPIQWSDSLDERELLAIELEENVKRSDLTWQDQCDALRRYHELQVESQLDWTQAKTAEALGFVPAYVSERLAVAEQILKANPRVLAAKEYSTAKGITTRQNERRKADELSLIGVMIDEPLESETSVPVSPILNVSFLDWVAGYEGPPFNLIHCDFPYGINADKFNQGAADSFGGYEDSPEIYWALCNALVSNKEKLLGTSGHVIFWFSMRYYTETLALLKEHFWVDPYPLVWHKSDNKGTLPDPERGPRRVYEVAFLCSHGDRKIISSVSNTFSGPTLRSSAEHMSEKSPDMLAHFMRMMVDENTRLLDPTCGSGSALRAADRLGAGSVLGLELNEEFAANARRAWDERGA